MSCRIQPKVDPRHTRPSLDGERFDVVVVGGGINGVAIAREAALAGRRTLLVERHDFASGTTSRSTRIIHGGLRYLEHGEINLVRESLRERERLLQAHPHLVRPMQFLLAISKDQGRRSALEIRFGLWLYRRFGGTRLRRSAAVDRARIDRQLDAGHEWSIFEYDDAQCEFPERLVAEWLVEAVGAGAVVRNYAEALAVERLAGRVRALRLRDRLAGHEARVESAWIVNAAGPWVDAICARAGLRTPAPLIGGIRGSHIVVERFPGAPAAAIYTEALDGRPIFVVPWNGQLLVGTTEIRDSGDPGRTEPSTEETTYLFRSLQRLFPHAPLRSNNVRYAFAGVRPLPFAPEQSPATVTRNHILRDHAADGAAGMISVIGGKLTTAVSLARECMRRISSVRRPESERMFRPGGFSARGSISLVAGYEIESSLGEWSRVVAQQAGIPERSARAIAEWHGRRALAVAGRAHASDTMRAPLCDHSDHLVAEAVEAVHAECAVTLADILLRRVPVALGACWSAECSVAAAQRIGRALQWHEREIATELDLFEQERAAFLRKVSPTAVVETRPEVRAA